MSGPQSLYTVLKDFALPVTALAWGIFVWFRDNWRVLSITQENIEMFSVVNRVSELDGLYATTFAFQVVITNDSPKANIVVAKYTVRPPWNDPKIEALDDPKEASPSRERYTFPGSNIDFPREWTINHRRFQYGTLQPGDCIRGMFFARGSLQIPADLSRERARGIEVEFIVTDTRNKDYTRKVRVWPEMILRLTRSPEDS